MTVLIAGVLAQVLGLRHSRSGIKTKSKDNCTHVLCFSAENHFPCLTRQGIAQCCRCSSCAAEVLGVASVVVFGRKMIYRCYWHSHVGDSRTGVQPFAWQERVGLGQKETPDCGAQCCGTLGSGLAMRCGWSSLGNVSWKVCDSQ